MINIFIFLSIVFIFTFIVGRLIEKIKIPWIFATLILGTLIAIYNPFSSITSSETFAFLAKLGMYFLLFIVGYEIDIKKLKKSSGFLIRTTVVIILLEGFAGSLLVHFVFGYSWLISIIVASSFATVGEAVLVPILDKFKIINTKLGQSLIGIGVLDDIVELFILVLVAFLVGSQTGAHLDIILVIISLILLVGLTYGLTKLRKKKNRFAFIDIDVLFLFILAVFFIFIGIGEYGHIAPLAALIAGLALRTFIPDSRLVAVEGDLKTMCYGFFAPMFFLSVGISLDVKYLITFPLLIILVTLVSKAAKLLGAYFMGRKELGVKQSILLGMGLSIRFSTSIVIIKLLFDNGLVGIDLYSVIVASSIIFKFVIPPLFSNLLVRWKVAKVWKPDVPSSLLVKNK